MISSVTPGKYSVTISHLNYQPFGLEILVKEDRNMEFRLKQAAYELDAFEVVANEKMTQVNDMSLVSTNTFTIKMAAKFPTVLEDPGRIATLYAGVSGSQDDTQNNIIVRGNTPQGNSWRIEGIDVVSPSHFTKEGDSRGNISIIDSNLMDRSDILTTAYPAQYGNAFGGFFDIRLKEGSKYKWSWRPN
ncbi:MAG: TonB-dependent receptor [Bacteroidetes bacterium]|nr:TonB-dependent receptor [Bacteroidota bacterium]